MCFLLISDRVDAPSPQTAYARHVIEPWVFGDEPTEVANLVDRTQPVVELSGEAWVHSGEEMVTVVHLYGEHQVLLLIWVSGSVGRES